MINDPDDVLQAYIQKVIKIQQEQKQRPLDVDEMNKIAEELGMSPEEVRLIKKKLEDYIARGKGYSRYEDWDSAIEEFSQALVLGPGNVDALFGIANAYRNRWLIRKNKEDFNQAKKYVKKALMVNPHHDDSFRLASELNKGGGSYNRPEEFDSLKENFKNLTGENFDQVFDAETFKLTKRLRKSYRDKKIFGVCAGIAEYLGVDPTWVRIGFIMGVVFGGGASIPLYILLAFVMPKQ